MTSRKVRIAKVAGVREIIDPCPRGSIHTPTMELGPPNPDRDGLLGPYSIIGVFMDPPGFFGFKNSRAEVDPNARRAVPLKGLGVLHYPKAQNGPKALYDMVFRPKGLKI